ncbi:MAG: hypothetical protein FK732_00870 [Asgard group archaeon]|nr:hypothetical protein [Asgard group archaeon]
MQSKLCRFFVITIILLLVISITTVLKVKAQTKTITVPDDYAIIANAIGNATSGDTIFVRTGLYKEHSLFIYKPLKLIGENAENTIIENIDPPTRLFGSSIMVGATAIHIRADNITISGFKITTGGRDIVGGGNGTQIVGNILEDGIQISSGNYQNIANNIINGRADLMSPYNFFINNTGNCELAIQKAGNQGYNNEVINNTFVGEEAGILLYQTHDNLIKNNKFVNCSWAIHSTMSYQNLVFANTIANCNIGIAVVQGSMNESFYANNIINNNYAVAVSGNNKFYHNNFINNKNQVESADLFVGPNPPSSIIWDDGGEGNFWSHYHGVDGNHDGIGDTLYVINDDNTDRYPLMFPYDIENDAIVLESPNPTPTPEPEPFSTTLALASISTIAVISVAIIIYFKKAESNKLRKN